MFPSFLSTFIPIINFWKQNHLLYVKAEFTGQAVSRRQPRLEPKRRKLIAQLTHFKFAWEQRLQRHTFIHTHSLWILCQAHFIEEENEAQNTRCFFWRPHTEWQPEEEFCLAVSLLPFIPTAGNASAQLDLGGTFPNSSLIRISDMDLLVGWPLFPFMPSEMVPSSKTFARI